MKKHEAHLISEQSKKSKPKLLLALIAAFAMVVALPLPALNAQEVVGEEVTAHYESPHPYSGGSLGEQLVWSQTIQYKAKAATYVALHFSYAKIGKGDRMIVKSPDGTRSWAYTDVELNAKGSFWSIPIYGNTAIVEIHSANKYGGEGYVIDKIARGFTEAEMSEKNVSSICGDDDSKEAKCFQSSEPMVYEESRAVARLWTSGITFGTGWLFGDEGHLMTNEHNVDINNGAAGLVVEMMAEGSDCGVDCMSEAACPGIIVATTTLVQLNADLDYALLLLPSNVSSTYGYLQTRAEPTYIGEQIYIAGHPLGWGKRISFYSDSPNDPNGVATIHEVIDNNCPDTDIDLAYYADTRPRSSGSPIISYNDHLVVGIHACGTCPNGGISMASILEDLNVIPHNAISCGNGHDIVITEPLVTMGADQDILGNIIIITGSQLTVTATLRFGAGKGIVVRRGAKLHLNGGTLTNCPTSSDWRGINVEGNASASQPSAFGMPGPSDAGVVLINNLAIVSNARNAISTTRFNESWNQPYWGGLIHCENATFTNNRRVAEFMKYDLENKSKFVNCTMDGGDVGVTIWDTDNVTFNRNRFYNMRNQGLLVYDAGAIVKESNDFHYNEKGIEYQATYPYVGKLEVGAVGTDPNYFLENTRHIYVNSTAFGGGLEIVNNEFFESSTAIRINGPSFYKIRKNVIDGTTVGVSSIGTGAGGWNQHNYIEKNGINASAGVLANGSNKEMQFLCNTFGTTLFDFRMLGNSAGTGEIRTNQGTPSKAVGNCFTAPGVEIDIATISPTNSFNYYAFQSEEEICQWPLNPGNYVRISALNNDCLSDGIISSEPPTKQDYDNIKGQIATTGSTSTSLLSTLVEEKDRILNALVMDYVSNGNIVGTLSLLDEEGTTTAKMMKYGVLVGVGNYSAAATELNALPSLDSELSAFKQVQNINLERLQQGLNYELPAPDEAVLESVATSGLGVNSYARALLGLLKGRFFDEDESLEFSSPLREDALDKLAAKNTVDKVAVYPNPTTGVFSVAIPEGLGAVRLQVMSSLGGIQLDQPIGDWEGIINVQGQAWNNGIYWLVVRDGAGKVVHSQMLVMAHRD